MIKGAKAIVFDFDGTLVDASRAIIASFNAALEKRGRAPMSESEIRSMIGRPLRDMFADVFEDATPEEIERCIDRYREVFMPISRSLSQPLPGLRETLPLLGEHMKLAIATSRTVRGTHHILEAMGLTELFSAIVGIGDVTECKPHPEAVLLALDRVHVPPAQCIMVGDTTDDVQAGGAAGTATIGISLNAARRDELTAAGADYVVEDLFALKKVIDLGV